MTSSTFKVSLFFSTALFSILGSSSSSASDKESLSLARTAFLISNKVANSFPSESSRVISTYTLKVPKVDRRTLSSLVHRLGFDNLQEEFLFEDETTIATKVGTWYFEVEKFSGLEFAANLETYRKQILGVDWHIGEQELIQTAQHFIDTFSNVDTNQLIYDRIRYTICAHGTQDGAEFYEDITEADVVFSRVIDGVPVIGPGSKIVITIDANGNVNGYYKLWREIDQVGVPVVTVSSTDSVKELINNTKQLRANYETELTKAAFGLWAGSRHTLQEYFLPAHNFVYTPIAKDGTTPYKSMAVIQKGYNGADISMLIGRRILSDVMPPTEPDTHKE